MNMGNITQSLSGTSLQLFLMHLFKIQENKSTMGALCNGAPISVYTRDGISPTIGISVQTRDGISTTIGISVQTRDGISTIIGISVQTRDGISTTIGIFVQTRDGISTTIGISVYTRNGISTIIGISVQTRDGISTTIGISALIRYTWIVYYKSDIISIIELEQNILMYTSNFRNPEIMSENDSMSVQHIHFWYHSLQMIPYVSVAHIFLVSQLIDKLCELYFNMQDKFIQK